MQLLSKALLSLLLVSVALPAAEDDPIVVIAHPSNPNKNISSEQLNSIYRGLIQNWHDGQKIIVVNQKLGSPSRSTFYHIILDSPPNKEFMAPGSPKAFKPKERGSDASVKSFIRRLPNAIGYIHYSALDDSVVLLSIDDLTPEHPDYVLK